MKKEGNKSKLMKNEDFIDVQNFYGMADLLKFFIKTLDIIDHDI